MSTPLIGEPAFPEVVPCDFIVYRTIRRGWRDDATGELKTIAFIRRPNDSSGLSVNSHIEAAKTSLGNPSAVVTFHVGHIRNLGLDVVPTPTDRTHADIVNLPSAEEQADSTEQKTRAEHLAGELLKQCRFAWSKSIQSA